MPRAGQMLIQLVKGHMASCQPCAERKGERERERQRQRERERHREREREVCVYIYMYNTHVYAANVHN